MGSVGLVDDTTVLGSTESKVQHTLDVVASCLEVLRQTKQLRLG